MLDFRSIGFLLGQNFSAEPIEICVPQLWTFYAGEREGSRVYLGGDILLGVSEPTQGRTGRAESPGMGPRSSTQPCSYIVCVYSEHLFLEEGLYHFSAS